MNNTNKILLIILILLPNKTFGEKVLRIIDGDTFEIGKGEKVRMIGINTPEESDIYGFEATNYLSDLILGKEINLIPDQESKDRDRYGRLLRYTFIDSIDINKKMIEDGFAFAYLKYKFTKKDEYRNAQLSAQNSGFGIWGKSPKETNLNKKENESDLPISTELAMLIVGVVILVSVGIKVMFSE